MTMDLKIPGKENNHDATKEGGDSLLWDQPV
jgi:hypothetical protein